MLLGKGGQTVYQGSTAGVDHYFHSLGFVRNHGENIADWFIDITSNHGVRFGQQHIDKLMDEAGLVPIQEEGEGGHITFRPSQDAGAAR